MGFNHRTMPAQLLLAETEPSTAGTALIQGHVAIVAVLLAILALLFGVDRHPRYGKLFKFVPLLVFAYFVPGLLSNLGVIPLEAPVYKWIKAWLLPASLLLLTMSVDIPAILRLGKPAVLLFLTGTLGIVIGGPLALLACGWLLPDDPAAIEQAWKGLAALSGSWIGGGANFVAVGESVGVDTSTYGLMVVVDVAVANVWTATLLFFAGRNESMDQRINADRRQMEEVRERVSNFVKKVARPTSLADLAILSALAIGGTVVAKALAEGLPDIGNIVRGFTWVVILVTALGVALSFTPMRKLEGAGASALGSVFLFLLIAAIGAQADFAEVVKAPVLVLIGAVWMSLHATTMLLVRRKLRVPIFFAAVGSQANVGGAASAPVVAAAFHPALAPVGVLLAVGGYVLGTYAALLCAFFFEQVAQLL